MSIKKINGINSLVCKTIQFIIEIIFSVNFRKKNKNICQQKKVPKCPTESPSNTKSSNWRNSWKPTKKSTKFASWTASKILKTATCQKQKKLVSTIVWKNICQLLLGLLRGLVSIICRLRRVGCHLEPIMGLESFRNFNKKNCNLMSKSIYKQKNQLFHVKIFRCIYFLTE